MGQTAHDLVQGLGRETASYWFSSLVAGQVTPPAVPAACACQSSKLAPRRLTEADWRLPRSS